MTATFSFLLAPLQYDFMQHALLLAALAAVPAALLSCLLVVKGYALLGDAISHAVFPGVVIAYMLGLPVAAGAFVAGLLCATLTGYLHAHSRVRQDTLMGVVFSGMFALGLLLHAWIRSSVHLDHILLGDLLGADTPELLQSAAVALLVAAALALKWRDLLLHAFDPVQARVSGLNTAARHYGLLAAVSLTVVASLQAVGLILAIALLIVPGATALLLARTFGRMLCLSCAAAVLCSVLGVYLSFFLDSAPAPTIAVLLGLAFTAAFARSLWQARAARRGNAPASAARQGV